MTICASAIWVSIKTGGCAGSLHTLQTRSDQTSVNTSLISGPGTTQWRLHSCRLQADCIYFYASGFTEIKFCNEIQSLEDLMTCCKVNITFTVLTHRSPGTLSSIITGTQFYRVKLNLSNYLEGFLVDFNECISDEKLNIITALMVQHNFGDKSWFWW